MKKGKTEEELRLEKKAKNLIDWFDKNKSEIEYFFKEVNPTIDWSKE